MAISGSSFCFAPLPIFAGKDYKHWEKKMETFFTSQHLWYLFQNEGTSTFKVEDPGKDAQALYYIQQAVAPEIFPKIISASSAKNAWDILEKEYNHNFLKRMDLNENEILQKSNAKWAECGICDIPNNMRSENPAAYIPQSVSIGPLHHGRPELANMEKRKIHYAESFLDRTQKPKGLFVEFIGQHEELIRSCYSKKSPLSSREYVEMIMLDSLFIIELFIRCQDGNGSEYADDSLFHELWLMNNIQVDLLLFENQLPCGFLCEIYQLGFHNVEAYNDYPFTYFCSAYFNVVNKNPIILLERELIEQLHFTGLKRYLKRSIIPEKTEVSKNTQSLKCAAKKLSKFKVKFSGIEDGSLIGIRFNKRVFSLPRFVVDNTTERIYGNMIALEQCLYKKREYICSYILLLQLLIKKSDDVAVLVEDGAIVNRLESNQAVVNMLNKLSKHITVDHFYFSDICEELDDYCSSWSGWLNYCIKTLKDVYFCNVWRGAATIGAIILLVLTFIQALTSILLITVLV